MKKFLSLILALIMVLSATAVVFFFFFNTAAVSLYDIRGNLITTKTYTVGETFEVTVYLNTSRIGTIGSLKADQTYSSDILKLADEYFQLKKDFDEMAELAKKR